MPNLVGRDLSRTRDFRLHAGTTSHDHDEDLDTEIESVTDRVHDDSWSANLEKPHHAESRDLVVEQAGRAVEHTANGNHVNLVTHGEHGHPETYRFPALDDSFGDDGCDDDISWEYVEQCGCGGHVTRVRIE